MEIQKKYSREFFEQFKYLKEACTILSMKVYQPYKMHIVNEVAKISNLIDEKDALSIRNFCDEIEQNLFSINQSDRDIYIRGILNDFLIIASFLNFKAEKGLNAESNRLIASTNEKMFADRIKKCHKLIVTYILKITKHVNDLPEIERYILKCFFLYKHFFESLDKLCQNFGLDICDLQKNQKLQIWHRENSKEFQNEDQVKIQRENTKYSVSPEKQNMFKKKVAEKFQWMKFNDRREHKKILADDEYEKLVEWTTLFFINGFIIPKIDNPIEKINTAKGNIFFAFKELFKESFPANTFPDSLFEFIQKSFYELRNDKISNMKKTKEPQYYKDLVSKNK